MGDALASALRLLRLRSPTKFGFKQGFDWGLHGQNRAQSWGQAHRQDEDDTWTCKNWGVNQAESS